MPTLSEAESKRLLARHGVPVPAEALVATPDEAAAAAAEHRVPGRRQAVRGGHRPQDGAGTGEAGTAGPGAVAAAAADLLAAARPDDGDVGLLVGAMVAGARELIAGFVRDDEFGPCVMLGVGGVLAEAVGDVGFRLVPLEGVDAEDLVDELSNQALLGPVRGEPAVDRAALAGDPPRPGGGRRRRRADPVHRPQPADRVGRDPGGRRRAGGGRPVSPGAGCPDDIRYPAAPPVRPPGCHRRRGVEPSRQVRLRRAPQRPGRRVRRPGLRRQPRRRRHPGRGDGHRRGPAPVRSGRSRARLHAGGGQPRRAAGLRRQRSEGRLRRLRRLPGDRQQRTARPRRSSSLWPTSSTSCWPARTGRGSARHRRRCAPRSSGPTRWRGRSRSPASRATRHRRSSTTPTRAASASPGRSAPATPPRSAWPTTCSGTATTPPPASRWPTSSTRPTAGRCSTGSGR